MNIFLFKYRNNKLNDNNRTMFFFFKFIIEQKYILHCMCVFFSMDFLDKNRHISTYLPFYFKIFIIIVEMYFL